MLKNDLIFNLTKKIENNIEQIGQNLKDFSGREDGKYFIPENAIRDEGLSYHYLPASRTVNTHSVVNSAIEEALSKFNKEHVNGTIWTVDAMYRETPNRTERRRKEGAIGVDMECASLSACAKFNGLRFGSLLYFTDRVRPSKWEWRKYDKFALREELVNICLYALELL